MSPHGQQLAAWLGLVPRQYSTGGKTRQGRIIRQGDKYSCILLIHGAHSLPKSLGKKQDIVSVSLGELSNGVGRLERMEL
jgi:transposase